jgi:hypothetical protein
MITFEVDFDEVVKNLRDIGNKSRVRVAVKYALSKVAIQMRKDSIPLVPRDTGELVNSWRVDKGADWIEVGYDIIYAMYQHQGMRADGTHIIRNRPAGGQSFFLKEPLDSNLQKYFDIFEKEVFTRLFG